MEKKFCNQNQAVTFYFDNSSHLNMVGVHEMYFIITYTVWNHINIILDFFPTNWHQLYFWTKLSIPPNLKVVTESVAYK